MREELAHHFLCLLFSQVLSRLLVDFLRKLDAMVYHLHHSHILRELAVLIAVYAVISVWSTISIRAEYFLVSGNPQL